MKNENNILIVPVDFEEHSNLSVQYADKLSKQIDGKIHLVHVVTSESWWKGAFNSNMFKELAAKKLESIVEEFNLSPDTEMHVLEGTRHKAILEYADRIQPRYLILADNYPSTKGIKKIGSTLSQIIISSKFPVITAKSVPETIFKNVLLPLDLTRNCSLKLEKSVKLAKSYHSTIKIASVLFGTTDHARINEKLSRYKKMYDENQINYSTQLIKKKKRMAFQEILNTAEKNNCDAILIMTHKETGIDNYLGAFAHHIINEATIPVISITKGAAKEKGNSYLTPFVDPFGIIKP